MRRDELVITQRGGAVFASSQQAFAGSQRCLCQPRFRPAATAVVTSRAVCSLSPLFNSRGVEHKAQLFGQNRCVGRSGELHLVIFQIVGALGRLPVRIERIGVKRSGKAAGIQAHVP